MPSFFEKFDKIKPAYDAIYNVVLFLCKILLIIDILITTMAVTGRYVEFIPDPAWSEEVVLSAMSYMAVLAAALAIRKNSHIRMTAFVTSISLKRRLSFWISYRIFLYSHWPSSCS